MRALGAIRGSEASRRTDRRLERGWRQEGPLHASGLTYNGLLTEDNAEQQVARAPRANCSRDMFPGASSYPCGFRQEE